MQQKLDNYLRAFYDASCKLPAMMQLKLDHSQRVSQIMAELSAEMQWPAADVDLATAIGLLHDLGRFEQYARFGTFRDALSVDHGQLGAEVAGRNGLLAHYTEADRALIISSIRHHNARGLPELSSARAMNFLKLTRDADKLDICEVLYQAYRTNAMADYPEIFHSVAVDAPPTPEALADLRAGHNVSFRYVNSLADFFLMQASWSYDINFPASARRFLERNVVMRLREVLPDWPEIRACLQQAHAWLVKLSEKGLT